MELAEKDLEAIHDTHDKVIKLSTIIIGNGSPGLCDKVDEVTKSHSDLKLKVYTLIGILVGSGIISGSIIGIKDLIK